MAAIVASLVIAIFAAGFAWLAFGNRLELDPDERQNDILNLAAYVGAFFFVSLVVIFAVTRG
jgi:hypothetical protein